MMINVHHDSSVGFPLNTNSKCILLETSMPGFKECSTSKNTRGCIGLFFETKDYDVTVTKYIIQVSYFCFITFYNMVWIRIGTSGVEL